MGPVEGGEVEVPGQTKRRGNSEVVSPDGGTVGRGTGVVSGGGGPDNVAGGTIRRPGVREEGRVGGVTRSNRTVYRVGTSKEGTVL